MSDFIAADLIALGNNSKAVFTASDLTITDARRIAKQFAANGFNVTVELIGHDFKVAKVLTFVPGQGWSTTHDYTNEV